MRIIKHICNFWQTAVYLQKYLVMATIASIDLNFTYAQVLSLVKQLNAKDKKRLLRDMQKEPRTAGFRKLIKNIPDIDDATILAECKMARQEIYNRTHGK